MAAFERHPAYSQQEKVGIDVLKRFGFYSTESNGHLSEYLPWYRKRPDEIHRWIDMSEWIHGETGGYLRYSTESRNCSRPTSRNSSRKLANPLTSQGERTSTPVTSSRRWRLAAATGATSTLRSGGSSPICPKMPSSNRPALSIDFGLNMVAGLTLSDACAATCLASVNVQRMSVKAATTGDVEMLKLSVLHDPLVGAICSPEEVWQMVDEMLVTQAQWLPQYADGIPAAKERLARSTLKTRVWSGAARREIRSVDEVRREAAARKEVALGQRPSS